MIVLGTPYTDQRLLNMAEITSGTPYGAAPLAGIDGSRQPSENGTRHRPLPRPVAHVTNALFADRNIIGVT